MRSLKKATVNFLFVLSLLLSVSSVPTILAQGESELTNRATKKPNPNTYAKEIPNLSAIDIIPENATLGLCINNIEDLQSRLKESCSKIDKSLLVYIPFVVQYGRTFIKESVGVPSGIDESAASALIKLDVYRDFDFKDTYLVLPVKDKTLVASHLGVEVKDLVEGKIIDRNLIDKKYKNTTYFSTNDEAFRYFTFKGNHLLFSGAKHVLRSAISAKPIRKMLNESEIETFEKSDFVIFSNANAFRKKEIASGEEDPIKTIDQYFNDSLDIEELTSFTLGFKVDQGLGCCFVANFDGPKSKKYLTDRITKNSKSVLDNLPNGKVVFSSAFNGGKESSRFIQDSALLSKINLFKDFFDVEELFSPRDQLSFFTIIDQAQGSILDSRLAVYLNEHPSAHGLFSLVSIVETKDAAKFIEEMTSMENFFNASLLDPDESKEKLSNDEIDRLIGQLGSSKYRVRELATHKLILIGAPAIDALSKNTQAKDFEVRARARYILKKFDEAEISEQSNALSANAFAGIKPQFGYVANQEKIANQNVDWIKIRLRQKSNKNVDQFKQLLGGDWNKIRMVTIGQKVIFLFGSQTLLLEKTIANVKQKKLGLGDSKKYRQFKTSANERLGAQLHLSIAQMQHLLDPTSFTKQPPKTQSASSLGMHIDPQRIRLDFFSSIDEIKILVENLK